MFFYCSQGKNLLTLCTNKQNCLTVWKLKIYFHRSNGTRWEFIWSVNKFFIILFFDRSDGEASFLNEGCRSSRGMCSELFDGMFGHFLLVSSLAWLLKKLLTLYFLYFSLFTASVLFTFFPIKYSLYNKLLFLYHKILAFSENHWKPFCSVQWPTVLRLKSSGWWGQSPNGWR